MKLEDTEYKKEWVQERKSEGKSLDDGCVLCLEFNPSRQELEARDVVNSGTLGGTEWFYDML